MATITSEMPTTAPMEGSNSQGKTSEWLKLAQDAYSRSTNYIDANYRKGWEDNLRMFQSKHPRDSKYNSEAYKYRSRVFRPKSRSVLRKNEATAVMAFFSNPDVVGIEPVNQDDPMQLASAAVMQELMQYRLTKTIPWFLTLIGGFQDAMTVGLVCSMQVWRYRTKTENIEQTAEMPGFGMVKIKLPQVKIIEDKPCIELFPIENIRFDPASHWNDIVGTSPYLIMQIPMYINDVLDNMESEDRAGHSWKKIDKKTLMSAKVSGMDALRQTRNDGREDAEAVTSEVNEFDVIMVHLNFIKTGDTTYAYYTLEDKHILSEPMPVEEMFLHCQDGRPPVQIGFCVIETHKAVPTSIIGLTSELQKEANEIANQRLDNVKFVLNKRWIIRRGANIDVESLMRNVPGGATLANNVETDMREVNWQDVTSSAYQEQNLVNNDFDDLAGNFAQSSVQTNRSLNETVGGMRLMAQGANLLTEYTIRVLVETWVEPVLRQLVKMEQAYETDEVILAIAAQKAKLFQKYGMNQVTDSLLNNELTISVNIGMGATDPDARLQKFQASMKLYSDIAAQGSADIDLPEVRKQLFGLSGFRDGEKFFKKEVDPKVQQLMDALEKSKGEAQQMIQQAKEQLNGRERALDQRETKMDIEELQMKYEFGADAQKVAQEMQLQMESHRQELLQKQQEHIQAMRNTQDKAEQDMEIARYKAEQETQIAEYRAHMDALIKKFTAQQDATIKAINAPRKTELLKSKDGEPTGSISRVM